MMNIVLIATAALTVINIIIDIRIGILRRKSKGLTLKSIYMDVHIIKGYVLSEMYTDAIKKEDYENAAIIKKMIDSYNKEMQ
jgi:hypothetical protein